MIKCRCLTNTGEYIYEEAYTWDKYPYEELDHKFIKKYYRVPATFDIETTTISNVEKPYAFMYVWQFCLDGKVVIGRTWKEFNLFIDELINALGLEEDKKLVIYVHNLSYEFEFIRDFIEFKDVFATAKRKVLKASTNELEFRCSYYLSNMNLAKFISNTPNAIHYKGVDDLDYRKIRTPQTKLTPTEYGYCYNDVKGLEEAILHLLIDDDLKTIPHTSTGYVRRDCRLAMRKNKKNRKQFQRIRLYPETYTLLQECFRGGNTASNRYLCDELLHDVGSYDISSSYPYVMVDCDYPIGNFNKWSIESIEELDRFNNRYCTIGRYVFINIRVKESTPIPYIPISKCNSTNEAKAFNGRVLEASLVNISLTNIDLEIINNQYEYDEMFVADFYFSRKGKLPKELINQVIHYYELKTTLKGVENKEYEYFKSKNKLNSIYGMMVTAINHDDIKIVNGEWLQIPSILSEALDKFYSNWNSFLSYQWGVFVTANARYRLQEAIDVVGMDTVYCDTDSVKYIGKHDDDFKALNDKLTTHISFSNNGKDYPLGIWDSENKEDGTAYDEFKTLGSKKYAFNKGGKIGVTVSGLSKKLGAKELQDGNGLLDFNNGKVFNNSGRTVAYFNNEPIHTININNVKIVTGSNIAIVDTTYTLGITDTMLDIITNSKLLGGKK